MITAHHAVVDGWSLMLLVGEMFAGYFGAGDQQDLSDGEGFDAIDFARWQRRFMASPEGRAQLAYWLDLLRDPPAAQDLPYDEAPPAGGKLAMRVGRFRQAAMTAADSAAVRRFAAGLGTSRYVVMLAAFELLLHRYTGRTDLLVSGTAAARTRPEFEQVVGSVYIFI